jgi:hypothetical protein
MTVTVGERKVGIHDDDVAGSLGHKNSLCRSALARSEDSW